MLLVTDTRTISAPNESDEEDYNVLRQVIIIVYAMYGLRINKWTNIEKHVSLTC